MAVVDLEEVRCGQAFKNHRIISADGSWNLFSWHQEDYYTDAQDADKQQPASDDEDVDDDDGLLDTCIKRLVHKEIGRTPAGRVLLLTNLRCFGYVFNPVSVYYCLTEAGDALDAVVLEVSNTPWLQKRMYVLDMSQRDDVLNQEVGNQTGVPKWFRSKWKKDFHVSPFFDVFYNYDWMMTVPGLADGQLHIKAESTRRSKDAQEGLAQPRWVHTVGAGPVTPVDHMTTNRDSKNKNKEEAEEEGEAELTNDGPRTFNVGLHLKRSNSQVSQLFGQPFMTASVVLYIHLHAGWLMLKGARMKLKPTNSRKVGLVDAVRHLAVFAVAIAYEVVVWPVAKLKRAVGVE
jgi:DUF1365 family protein